MPKAAGSVNVREIFGDFLYVLVIFAKCSNKAMYKINLYIPGSRWQPEDTRSSTSACRETTPKVAVAPMARAKVAVPGQAGYKTIEEMEDQKAKTKARKGKAKEVKANPEEAKGRISGVRTSRRQRRRHQGNECRL